MLIYLFWEVLTAVRESGNTKGQRQIKNSGPKQPNWRVERRLGKIRSLKQLKKDIRGLIIINFTACCCHMKKFWQTLMLSEKILYYTYNIYVYVTCAYIYIHTHNLFRYKRLIILIKQGFMKGVHPKNKVLLMQFDKSSFILIVLPSTVTLFKDYQY